MRKALIDNLLFFGFIVGAIFTGAGLSTMFYVRWYSPKPQYELLWEGSADWIAVNNIERENDLLKFKLDELQAHYDSMMCTRWPVRERK